MIFAGLLCAYLLGSFPFAIWISKYFYHVDIRTLGSGNAGSTNMYRNFGFKAGFATQLLDILKSGLATSIPIFLNLSHDIPYLQGTRLLFLFGISSVLGHVYPIFANFQGGKGVNSILGMMLVITPLYTVLCLLVFGVVLYIWEFVSLGSILATFSFLIFHSIALFYGNSNDYFLLGLGIFLFLVILYTHRENIVRIKNGNESKASFIQKLKNRHKNYR